MQAEGLCRFTGITAENASGGLERLLNTGKVDVLEIAYNAIYQCACDHQRAPTGIVPFARALGMGVTTMRTTTCLVLPRLVQMAIPDADVGKLVRLAINFVLSTPEIDCALVGMRTPDEVRMNADLADDTSARIEIKALHERYV